MVGNKNLLTRYALILIALCGALAACDLLAPQAIEISAINPSSTEVRAADLGELWMEFSRNVDHAKAELAFSLRENGTLLNGTFRWAGKRMYFQPVRPVASGKKYELLMGMGVEDSQGVSMEREFRLVFSTIVESTRPTLALSWQDGRNLANGMTISDRMGIIRCTFSKAVNRLSFTDACSLSPNLRLAYDWSDGDRICEIRPLEEMQWQTDYHLLIRDSLTDLAGNNLLSPGDAYFHLGSDSVSPTVVSVRNVVGGASGGVSLSERNQVQPTIAYDSGWETDWGWEVQFSEPIQRANLENFFAVEPAVSYSVVGEGIFVDRVQIKANHRLAWNTLYSLQIKPGVADAQGNVSVGSYGYRFLCDGQASQPPALEAMNLRLNPETSPPSYAHIESDHSLDYQTIDLGNFTPGNLNATRSYIDLYFTLAPNSEMDGLSVVSRLSVSSTNGCASLLPMAFQTGASLDPVPLVIANTKVVRVYLDVTNQIASGLIVLRLRSGFLDNHGLAGTLDGAWPVMK